jgi:hypothetical protein
MQPHTEASRTVSTGSRPHKDQLAVHPKHRLHLGSWNYRAGISTPEWQQLVCQATQRYSIDILAIREAALQETASCGSYRILTSHHAQHSNQRGSARNSGVALVLSNPDIWLTDIAPCMFHGT